MAQLIDFDQCPKIEGRQYPEICSKKYAIEYNGTPYMVKYPKRQLIMGLYSQEVVSCYSEHIGCKVFSLLGFPVQDTVLGYAEENKERKMLVACKDLTSPKVRLVSFLDTMELDPNMTRDAVFAAVHNLPTVLQYIQDQHYVDGDALKKYFWQVFIADAFLVNRERSIENLGFLMNEEENTAVIAPVYDCGDCLTPDVDDVNMAAFLANGEIGAPLYQQFVYGCGTSIFTVKGERTDYYSFLMQTEDKDCLAAAAEIIPKIDMAAINRMLDEELAAWPLRRDYYKALLAERYKLIMLPVLQRAEKYGTR